MGSAWNSKPIVMNQPFDWLTPDSRLFLKRDYLVDGVSPEQRISQIAANAELILTEMYYEDARNLANENPFEGFADKFYDYMGRGFYSLATPVWINFGLDRGLPVSCFGSYVDDSIESILEKVAEVGTMTKHGGGCSGAMSAIRPRGSLIKGGENGETGGSVHFAGLFDNVTNTISQGSARRGYFAAYWSIEHPDIEEVLRIRSEDHPIKDISIAVTITDKWMKEMMGENPKSDNPKQKLWAKVLKKRFETGFPYIMFIDNVNNAAPQVYKDKGLKIHASNMCAEICLHSSPIESFVCVLSSYNLAKWDDLVQTDAIETLIYFLDAVNEEFVRKSEGVKFLEAAHLFAKNQRALGAGGLGYHSLLQSKSIPFESWDAKTLNNKMWKTIGEKAKIASQQLAAWLGEPDLLKGYGLRNVTQLALAPTTSSSFILGQTSRSIEVRNSNYYTEKLAKGSYTVRNPELVKKLEELGKNTEETWADILLHGGSVQHLDFLSDHDKDVFKTFGEVNQREIVIQAIQRQKYIDQGQSLNLMIHPQTPPKEVSQLLIYGWENGLKTFYYQRSYNPAQELYRKLGNQISNLDCASCSA